MNKKYRNKNIIDAFQNFGLIDDYPEWFKIALENGKAKYRKTSTHVKYLEIYTPQGIRIATRGDWIIKDANGEIYPCKPEIFDLTYEEIKKSQIFKKRYINNREYVN